MAILLLPGATFDTSADTFVTNELMADTPACRDLKAAQDAGDDTAPFYDKCIADVFGNSPSLDTGPVDTTPPSS